MTPIKLDAIASHLKGCRTALAPVRLPDWASTLDLCDAYAVQNRIAVREAEAGNQPVGYKIGCTTKQGQATFGLRSPAYARLFSDGSMTNGATVTQRGSYRLGVECEIAMILGSTDAADHTGLPAIEHVAIACEVVEDRYDGLPNAGIACLIADNFANRGFVLGPPVAFEAFGAARLEILSSRIATSTGEQVEGLVEPDTMSAFQALCWLDTAARANGSELRRGDVILTGAIGRPLWLDKPSDVTLEIESVGSLSLSVR